MAILIPRKLSVFIKLTKQCNLHCSYCFERSERFNIRRINLSEAKEIMHKVRDYCVRNRIARLNLNFSGGEILMLGKRYLTFLFKYCRAAFAKDRIALTINVQTNLTLLDIEFIEIFKKYNIEVGTSFDVYGENRRFANGKSTKKIMIDKILLMLRNGLPLAGSIVVVNGRNYDKALKTYEFYSKTLINFHPMMVFPWTNDPSHTLQITIQQYINYLKIIATKHVSREGAEIILANIDSYIGLLKKGAGNYHWCAFEKNCFENRFFILNNGDVFPCYYLQNGEFYLGNILKKSLNSIVRTKKISRLRKRHNSIVKKCKGCRYLGLCNGGCMALAYYESGSLSEPSQFDCRVNRSMFKYIKGLLKKQDL